ncbi:MAG: helix-turn-helix domain-containing protein, partial [Acidimicrobiales bacterium]
LGRCGRVRRWSPACHQRRRLWGITEAAIDAFDALVAAAMPPGGCDDARQRRLLTLVLDGLVGDRDGGQALIQASPMRSGFPTAAAARAWVVDLLAAAARQEQQPWWQGCDDDGDPAIHGTPFKRLRNRTGLARVVLDRRIELKLSQELVAAECGVVQGEVQAWEAGTRIPTSAELDALARILDLDRHTLAGAETGSAVHRNELSAEQRAELDNLYWHTDTKIPDLAARFGLQGRSIHKLVTALSAGMRCQGCGEQMVFATRGPRRIHSADCPTCRRARILASIRAFAPTRGEDFHDRDPLG